MNILVIAAHPDDEVLGCGGTIARLSKEGHDVYVAILGEGMTSRYDKRKQIDQGIIKELQSQSRRASKLLGVKELFLYDSPDNRFDTVSLLDIVKIIEELIVKLLPSVIYTQNGGDLNIDHVITYRAVLTAARPQESGCVKRIYSYEVPSSTEWSFGTFAPVFSPNVFVDISSSFETKIDALRCYEGELRPFPHPRSPELVRALAMSRGATSGTMAAEAFMLVREIQ